MKLLSPKTDGFHARTEAEIEKFEARWAIGTRERLALAILLYTGLRRGDASRLGRQHVRDGVITMRTEKGSTPVIIPMLPELLSIINSSKTGDLAFVATPDGRPMTKESFGAWFKGACKAWAFRAHAMDCGRPGPRALRTTALVRRRRPR